MSTLSHSEDPHMGGNDSRRYPMVEPSRGVIAVAELLRQRYLSEHESDAPVSDWYPEAIEIVRVYLEAEEVA